MEQTSQPIEKKSKTRKSNYRSIRVQQETAKKLAKLLKQANKKQFGKKIFPDSILSLALDLLNDKHIKDLQDQSLSHADRLEIQYRTHLKTNPGISKDEYLGKLLRGEISSPPSENVTFADTKMQQAGA